MSGQKGLSTNQMPLHFPKDIKKISNGKHFQWHVCCWQGKSDRLCAFLPFTKPQKRFWRELGNERENISQSNWGRFRPPACLTEDTRIITTVRTSKSLNPVCNHRLRPDIKKRLVVISIPINIRGVIWGAASQSWLPLPPRQVLHCLSTLRHYLFCDLFESQKGKFANACTTFVLDISAQKHLNHNSV